VKIGVGVEGPSDWQFWEKVLHKHIRGCRFDIRNMKNRDKLIRAAPDLLDEFRGRKYGAAFIILDRDDDPCATHVISLFDPAIVAEAKSQPSEGRFLSILVAVRKLECWYLADAAAINAAIPGAEYSPPADTGTIGGEGQLKKLLQSHAKAAIGYNKIDFAKTIAAKFAPKRAENNSVSFKFAWSRITTICQR
jgi:hypothetical protein